MTQINKTTKLPINKNLLTKRMLIGAGIGLLLTSLFLYMGRPDPNWPKFWMVRPLIIVPLAGATGGAFSYYLTYITQQGGWRRALAVILSIVIFIIGLWMGFVLGFDGTYWD